MKSIKFKLWSAIVGITLLVILCIWVFQVVFIEQTYLTRKQNEILDYTDQISSMLLENGLASSQNDLQQIAEDHNYSIKIYQRGFDLLGNGVFRELDSASPPGSKNILDGLDSEWSILNNASEIPGRTRLFTDKEDGTYYIGARFENQGPFYLLVGTTLAPVSEALDSIQTQLFAITLGLIVLATIIAFIISRSLTKPISKLNHAAQEIAKGNLGYHVALKSKDELGELGESFNVMSKEIARASTLQRELIANVSHDIRTPLTMIKGYAETIKDLTGNNPEIRDQQLDIIMEESDRLNLLVNDMLDLSKLQAGQMELNYQSFNIADTLRDIMKRYDLLILNENYQFQITIPEQAIVYADEMKIAQVIYNLVNNATNHTGADKKVMVSLEDYEDRVVIRVGDTGKGIEPEYMPLIWDRYYKPYKKNDRKGMGTGLGLSIVKGILTAHGFRYGVDSTLGVGSTFWFEVHKPKPSLPES